MSEKDHHGPKPHLESARVALGNLSRARVGDVAWKHALGHLGMVYERLRELGVDDEPVSDPDAGPRLDPDGDTEP
jgi:hypothetical protein